MNTLELSPVTALAIVRAINVAVGEGLGPDDWQRVVGEIADIASECGWDRVIEECNSLLNGPPWTRED